MDHQLIKEITDIRNAYTMKRHSVWEKIREKEKTELKKKELLYICSLKFITMINYNSIYC